MTAFRNIILQKGTQQSSSLLHVVCPAALIKRCMFSLFHCPWWQFTWGLGTLSVKPLSHRREVGGCFHRITSEGVLLFPLWSLSVTKKWHRLFLSIIMTEKKRLTLSLFLRVCLCPAQPLASAPCSLPYHTGCSSTKCISLSFGCGRPHLLSYN